MSRYCNFCGNELTNKVIDLGHQPLSNSFLTKDQLERIETYYPLHVFKCGECNLVQATNHMDSVHIFNENYVYFSSQSPANISHAKDFVDIVTRKLKLTKDSKVLEVGSNDGYMLQFFKDREIKCVGVDPSIKCCKEAERKGIETLVAFFNNDVSKILLSNHGKFDLICGINVMNHQVNINSFVGGMKNVLAEDGSIVIEFPDLRSMLSHLEFDTIYQEHYLYFSLITLIRIFNSHKLMIYDIDIIPNHGGSLRIYATHEDSSKPRSSLIARQVAEELLFGVLRNRVYSEFMEDIKKIKFNIVNFLNLCYKKNQKVIAYGAAAKANTFFNYCKIDDMAVPFVVDKSKYKIGKYCPGSHIPVISPDAIREIKPDYILITAWNLKDEIMEQLSYIEEWNGSFVIAIPRLEVY